MDLAFFSSFDRDSHEAPAAVAVKNTIQHTYIDQLLSTVRPTIATCGISHASVRICAFLKSINVTAKNVYKPAIYKIHNDILIKIGIVMLKTNVY